MEQKLDLRIQKTYLALTQAFLQMMKEKPLEDIRISELCQRAMIRKSTFYKHFGDKYELLAFIVRQTQEKLNAQLKEKCTEGSVVGHYMELITLVFDYVGENKELFESAIQSNSFPLILSILSDQIILDIQQQLHDDVRSGETLPASPNLMAAFFVGGVMEIVYRQLQKGNSLNDPELLRQIEAMLNQFYQPLERKVST
jgi:AcrR family transcriptional regulator